MLRIDGHRHNKRCGFRQFGAIVVDQPALPMPSFRCELEVHSIAPVRCLLYLSVDRQDMLTHLTQWL
jgi:hypothetical protein